MKKLIIFDLDGTIVDTVESLAYSVNTCLERLALPPNPVENYKQYAGLGGHIMLKKSLINAGDKDLTHYPEIVNMYPEVFAEGCLYQVTAYDGIKEALDTLKRQGIMLAVLTNKAHFNAVKVLNKVFGQNYFVYILGETKGVPKKPAPDGVYKILAELSCQPDQCLYVGDTSTDMQTGKAAGIYTIGVLWGFRDKEELQTHGADATISQPRQLLNFL